MDRYSLSLRSLKRKGFFIDGVPGDLLHMAPDVFAQIFYQVFLKEIMQVREAVIFKGGRLVPAYKRGNPAECCNYRSLLVSSPIGKALHSLVRNELTRTFTGRMELQIGGLPGFSTSQASLALTLFHRHWTRQKEGASIIFIDIANAFYRLVREMFAQWY